MSAAALRRPARWMDAARAELRILASGRHLGWIAFFLFMVWSSAGVGSARGEAPFGEFRMAVVLMFLLPPAWQGRGGRERYVPLPMGDAARERVQVLCGALFAGAALAVGLALHVSMADWTLGLTGQKANPLDVFPRSYPVALTLAGVASYLLGAALALRSERPGRTLTVTFVLVMLALSAAGIQLERVEFEVDGPWDDPRFSGGTSLTVTAALAWVAVGACAVWVSAWVGGMRLPAWRISFPRRARTRASAAAGPPRPLAPGIRAPASPWTVFAAHVRLLGPRMVLPLLLAAYQAWLLRPGKVSYDHDGPGVISAAPLEILCVAAYLWPVLVWMDERQGRPWDEAHPAGTVARRLLHAAAGLAWLLGGVLVVSAAYAARVVDAGLLTSPLALPGWFWVGVPVAVTVTYCAGTVSAVLADRPLAAGIVTGSIVFPGFLALVHVARTGTLSPANLFAPLGWTDPGRWSPVGALVWVPLFVAAAAWALRRRVRWERDAQAYPFPEKLPVPPNLWYGGRRKGLA